MNARLISYVEQHRVEWQSKANLGYNTDGPLGPIGNNTVGALIAQSEGGRWIEAGQ